MKNQKNELIEMIAVGYEYEAMMDIGNGWESYEGCQQNLIMILEDPDTKVSMFKDDDSEYKATGKIRYHITLPSWWKEGSISLIFDDIDN